MSVAAQTARPRRPAQAGHPPLLLTQAEAIRFVGMARSTWYLLRKAGRLPSPVTLPGTSDPRWRAEDLRRWVDDLAAGTTG